MRKNLLSITANVITHGVAAFAGIDAVINLINGKYQIAAIEGLACAGIEYGKYLERKKDNFYKNIPELIKKIEETRLKLK